MTIVTSAFAIVPLVPETTATERCGKPVRGLALPVELEAGRADDDRGVGVVGLERGERLDGLPEALLVGEERAPRLHDVGDTRALERAQLAAQRRLDGQRLAGGRLGAAHAADRGVVLGAQAGQDLERVRRDLDPEPAQEVLERLEQVGVDGHRALLGVAGGQLEEGADRVRVPVDVEPEARLADRLDERQRRGRGRDVDLQALGAAQRARVEARAAEVEQRLGDGR